MKFIFFNVVVGVALVYLITGGSPEIFSKLGVPNPVLDTIDDVKYKVSRVEKVIEKVIEKVKEEAPSVPEKNLTKAHVSSTKDVVKVQQ